MYYCVVLCNTNIEQNRSKLIFNSTKILDHRHYWPKHHHDFYVNHIILPPIICEHVTVHRVNENAPILETLHKLAGYNNIHVTPPIPTYVKFFVFEKVTNFFETQEIIKNGSSDGIQIRQITGLEKSSNQQEKE